MRYSLWYDDCRGYYEIIRWQQGVPTVVQTNIRNAGKAQAALELWRIRERDRQLAQ